MPSLSGRPRQAGGGGALGGGPRARREGAGREPRTAPWGTPGSPRFPLKGSFKGDIGIDIDVDIMDIELDDRGT